MSGPPRAAAPRSDAAVEVRLQALVQDMLRALGVAETPQTTRECVQLLSESGLKGFETTKLASANIKRKLARRASEVGARNEEQFLTAYNALKEQGSPVMEGFLALISQILDDASVGALLSSHPQAAQQPQRRPAEHAPSGPANVPEGTARQAAPLRIVSGSALERPPEDRDLVDLTYGSKIVLSWCPPLTSVSTPQDQQGQGDTELGAEESGSGAEAPLLVLCVDPADSVAATPSPSPIPAALAGLSTPGGSAPVAGAGPSGILSPRTEFALSLPSMPPSVTTPSSAPFSSTPSVSHLSSSQSAVLPVTVRRFSSRSLVILNAGMPSDRSVVRFQDDVLLCSPEGYYVHADSNGSLFAQRDHSDPRARWTLVSGAMRGQQAAAASGATNSQHSVSGATGPVKVYDSVALRSSQGQFLGVSGPLVDSISKSLAATLSASSSVSFALDAQSSSRKDGARGSRSRSRSRPRSRSRSRPRHSQQHEPASKQESKSAGSTTASRSEADAGDGVLVNDTAEPLAVEVSASSIGITGWAHVLRLRDAHLPVVPPWLRQRCFFLPHSSTALEHQQGKARAVSAASGYTGVFGGSMPGEAQQDRQQKQQATLLNKFPVEVQEQLLVEDLLSAMLGLQGKWLRFSFDESGSPSFSLPPGALEDQSMVYVLGRVLPLCRYYVEVAHFVDVRSRYEYGLVSHALCAALRVMLKEYLVLVAQLEHQFRLGRLALQRLWFFVQPSLHSMGCLYRVVSHATETQVTGGALLNVIQQVMSKEGGDSQAVALFVELLTAASSPYFDMLEQWIYHGVIQDPYDEFLIHSKEEIDKERLRQHFLDSYWEERYTVAQDRVPIFLEKIAEKVLITGKYLNVIRECGRPVRCPVEEKIVFSVSQRYYAETIDKAYRFASQCLLDLLLREKQLLARLRSVKRYFLLSEGDFLVHFMDIAEEELNKAVPEIVPSKLESLLDLSIRTSVAVNDPFKDDLACYLNRFSLLQQLDLHIRLARGHDHSGLASLASPLGSGAGDDSLLEPDQSALSLSSPRPQTSRSPESTAATAATSAAPLRGVDAFTLAYRVSWPVSLIISKRTLSKYQLIFRHLFQCKHVERQLCSSWLLHQTTKELLVNRVLMEAYELRRRMLHFYQNFSYYMMVEVVEPNWHQLEEKLKQVNTVDEVLRHHDTFLEKCLQECLLTNPELLKRLSALTVICLRFARFTRDFFSKIQSQLGETLRAGQAAPSAAVDGASSVLRQTLQRRRHQLMEQGELTKRVAAQEEFVSKVRKAQQLFDRRVGDFIRTLRGTRSQHYEHHLANLGARLDYNGFYLSK